MALFKLCDGIVYELSIPFFFLLSHRFNYIPIKRHQKMPTEYQINILNTRSVPSDTINVLKKITTLYSVFLFFFWVNFVYSHSRFHIYLQKTLKVWKTGHYETHNMNFLSVTIIFSIFLINKTNVSFQNNFQTVQ